MSITTSLLPWPAVSAFTRIIRVMIIYLQPQPVITVSIPSRHSPHSMNTNDFQEPVQSAESHDPADGWRPPFFTRIAKLMMICF